jgi:CheY-like chemotaxis protein
MPEEVLDHIFEPFFTTKEVGQGSGLGLSMVYGFILQSGGHVEFESAVGHGTVVRLYLPAVPAGKDGARAAAGERERARGGAETILIVEDDDEVRALVAGTLEGIGYEAIAVADGEAALAALREHPEVALLFSDVVLPGGMYGPEVAVEARRIRPDLKVLFLSGYIEIAGIRAGQMPGEHELVRKPFRVSDVAEKVRAALDR